MSEQPRTASSNEPAPKPWKAEIHTAYSCVNGPRYFNGHYAEYADAKDARLIAAAPDLLAALKHYVEHHTRQSYDMALAAIAKAEGPQS